MVIYPVIFILLSGIRFSIIIWFGNEVPIPTPFPSNFSNYDDNSSSLLVKAGIIIEIGPPNLIQSNFVPRVFDEVAFSEVSTKAVFNNLVSSLIVKLLPTQFFTVILY